MRHHNKNKKFGRQRGARYALSRALLLALFTHGKIVTTETRAKALRPLAEKMLTRARAGSTSDVRILRSRLMNNEELTHKLVKEIAPKYKGRSGGYTRITKLGRRSGKGDASSMAMIELL